MAKVKTHNEWFRDVSLGGRKSCPTCKTKNAGQLYSWGEYHAVRWYTVKHFCQYCFVKEVKTPLLQHIDPCGCVVELQYKGGWGKEKPVWLTLD
jgi:hypothetical protein